MTQLILDVGGQNLALPESRQGGYSCEEQLLSKDLTMASGRVVRETVGTVWVLKYEYALLSTADKDKFLAACRAGQRGAISCTFLTPGDETVTGDFLVTSFTPPTFKWGRKVAGADKGIWGDFQVELREVSPHDSGENSTGAGIPAARGVSF